MEIIKELIGAIGGRLRSHFVGSILISFLVFNWDSVLFLLSDGNSALMKIAYVKQNWEYWWPLNVGLLIGFFNPWIVFGGALLAKYPSEKLHSLQDDTKHNRAMHLLENEATENDKKAELAKSKDDALKSIDDEDIRDSLKEKSASTAPIIRNILNRAKGSKLDDNKYNLVGAEIFELWASLTPLERSIIRRMGKKVGTLLTIVHDSSLSDPVQIDGQAAPKATLVEYSETMRKLVSDEILKSKISHSNKVSVYELTEFGLSLSNQLPLHEPSS